MIDDVEAARRPKSSSLRPLLGLLPFLWRYKGMATLAGVALVCAAAATLSLPLGVRFLIDGNFEGGRSGSFYFLTGLALFLALSSAARFYCVTWLGERIAADLRRAVHSHVLGLPPSFFEEVRTGEVITRLSADTTLVRTVMGSSASVALRNILLLFGALAMLTISSPILGMWVLLLIPLVVFPLLFLGRLVRRLSRSAQDALAETGAAASETLNAIQTVQSFTHEGLERDRFSALTEAAFARARGRIAARTFLTGLLIFVVFVAVAWIVWRGFGSVQSGEMSPGLLSQFIVYAVLAATALAALGDVWGEMQLAAGAAERLLELLGTRVRIEAPARPEVLPERVRGDVAFESVFYAYPQRPGVRVLSGITLRVKSGESVALVGKSGAGKTTLFHLLHRFDDPQSGRVTLDGIDVRRLDPEALRGCLASVLQDGSLFSLTVAENIGYGRPGAGLGEIELAARAAEAHGFIERLPEGYGTRLGERGLTLSGGQRQRLSIARALLRDAPVLLLDEATSSLDSESEGLIQKALLKATQGRTTLVIAHRLSTVKRADRIIVMEEGSIVAEGSHDDLLKGNELYRRLAREQFLDGDQLGDGAGLRVGEV